jgi:hypothetical protein
MLLALLVSQTVNMTKLAGFFSSPAKKLSRYRRMQRFFAWFAIDYDKIAGFIFRLFFVTQGKWYLTIDRTNWKWGDADINILTLAIAFKGIAIPIYWELLDKRGNSDTQERIALLQQFISRFGQDCIAGLLADREFVGEDWFGWLLKEGIVFYIRIKKNMLTTNSQGHQIHAYKLFYGLMPMNERVLYGRRNILGYELYVSGLKLLDGDFLIVVTNENPGEAIKIYGLRWEIESLFSCLKGRGFHFEDTHMTDQRRIKKLLALLAIAFCWAHKTGEWQHEQKPIKIKNHGRPEISLFRYGLDYLVEAIIKIFHRTNLFMNCIAQIRPPEIELSVTEYSL